MMVAVDIVGSRNDLNAMEYVFEHLENELPLGM